MKSFALLVATFAVGASTGAVPDNTVVERAMQIPKTRIDPNVFNDIIYIAGYCATYITAPCKNPPYGSKVQGYANANPLSGTDTAVTLFRRDATKEFVLAFPGSSSLQDFITDFTFIPVDYAGCKGCMVHSGFYHAFNSVRNDTKAIVDKAVAKYPSYKLTVAGHSLGGALANLAYAYLKSQNVKVSAVYTFGEPRVGNPAYANFVDRLSGSKLRVAGTYYRVTHANDGVPQLPSQSQGFQHSETEYWAKDGKDGAVPTAKTTFRCYGNEPSDCNDSAGGVFINEAHVSYPGLNVTSCGFP